MSNLIDISDVVPLILFTVDLTYIRSFSSDSSVLSFQFARVSLSISGFRRPYYEGWRRRFIIIYYIIPLHHIVPLHYLFFSVMCNSDMCCISIIKCFVKQLRELYIWLLYFIVPLQDSVLFYFFLLFLIYPITIRPSVWFKSYVCGLSSI